MLGEIKNDMAEKSLSQNLFIPTGKITIKSFDGKSIVNCHKVLASHVMFKARDDEPQYWLIGVSNNTFWGENSILLGWYANEEKINKEVNDIIQAIKEGVPSYELKYASKVKNKGLRVKLVNE